MESETGYNGEYSSERKNSRANIRAHVECHLTGIDWGNTIKERINRK